MPMRSSEKLVPQVVVRHPRDLEREAGAPLPVQLSEPGQGEPALASTDVINNLAFMAEFKRLAARALSDLRLHRLARAGGGGAIEGKATNSIYCL